MFKCKYRFSLRRDAPSSLVLLWLAGLFPPAVSAQTPYVNIDSPVANSTVPTVQGVATVFGWAIDNVVTSGPIVSGVTVQGVVKVFGWAIDNVVTSGPIVSGVTVQASGPTSPFAGAGYGINLYNAGYTNAYRPDVCNIWN